MSGFGLYQVINEPIHVTQSSSSLIDLLFCNNPVSLNHVHVSGGSDHSSISCCVPIVKPATYIFRRRVWLHQKADYQQLNDALEDSLPPEAILSGGDVNRTWPLLFTAFIYPNFIVSFQMAMYQAVAIVCRANGVSLHQCLPLRVLSGRPTSQSGSTPTVPSTLSDGTHMAFTPMEKVTLLNIFFASCFSNYHPSATSSEQASTKNCPTLLSSH